MEWAKFARSCDQIVTNQACLLLSCDKLLHSYTEQYIVTFHASLFSGFVPVVQVQLDPSLHMLPWIWEVGKAEPVGTDSKHSWCHI